MVVVDLEGIPLSFEDSPLLFPPFLEVISSVYHKDLVTQKLLLLRYPQRNHYNNKQKLDYFKVV